MSDSYENVDICFLNLLKSLRAPFSFEAENDEEKFYTIFSSNINQKIVHLRHFLICKNAVLPRARWKRDARFCIEMIQTMLIDWDLW